MRRVSLLRIILPVVLALGLAFYFRDHLTISSVPSPQPYKTAAVSSTPTLSPKSTTLALLTEINLDIPFTSQAPSKNWGLPYAEFCEEASSLMVASYINSWLIPTPEFAEQKMLEIKAFEEKRFGYYKDTSAEETAIILREFYKISAVKVMYNPTIDDIKKALIARKAVIIPVAGRLLGNPYFQSPGPLYHMLVIKGYTKEGNIITNDPGTRNGADYIYTPSVIMNAMHDWNGGNVETGKKVVLIVG